MWDSVQKLWVSIPSETQAAVIGALAATLTATIGAGFVVWQIGTQARHAFAQSRDNEAMRLRLDIYREIIAKCARFADAELEFSSFIRKFVLDLQFAEAATRSAQQLKTPDARVPELISRRADLSNAAIEIILITERWQIIDPRIAIFRTAINVASDDIDQAYGPYFEVALRTMPFSKDGNPPEALPWSLPSAPLLKELGARSDHLHDETSKLSCWIADFQLELQNALLGGLFEHQLPPRTPLDPRYFVITLADHDALNRHFMHETRWGQRISEVTREVQARQTTSKKIT